MKKTVSVLLALCLLFTLFSACQGGETESSKPKLAAEAQKEKAASSAQREEDVEVLRVVTDLDCRSTLMGRASNASQGKRTFQTILKHFGGTPSGIEVELEILPAEMGGPYDSELTHLRTEIMAGGGPDVFLMSGFGDGGSATPANTLFQNPESAMKKGFFLPLDDYIENAQFMEFDKLDQGVMAAGRNDQGQVILPMFYRLNEIQINREMDPAQFPSDWNGAAASDNELVQWAGAQWAGYGFRNACFGKIADNESEELLITGEELFQRTKEALELCKAYAPEMSRLQELQGQGDYNVFLKEVAVNVTPWGSGYIAMEDNVNSSYVLKNPQGEISAPIETWCAVNKNTQHPQDAFFIVDLLLSKKFLQQEDFWNKEPSYQYHPDQMTFFWMAGQGYLPVYSTLLTNSKNTYKFVNPLNNAQRKLLSKTRDEISYAYFTSNLDREIDRMYGELSVRTYVGEEVTDEEIRKATEKCYTTLKMMLAES